MTHFIYLWYLIRHKFWVAVGAWKLIRTGVWVSPWRILWHDGSKFTLREWRGYRRRFNDPLWGLAPTDRPEFDAAWNHHLNRNDHHWQYWVLLDERGDTHCLPMAEAALREMVADWFGAGRALHGRNEVVEWYEDRRSDICLHPTTRVRVEALLGMIGSRKVVPLIHFYDIQALRMEN